MTHAGGTESARVRWVSKTSTRAEATRARLFDAAVAAFAARGFHGTTTRDIASAAGMSPAALYVHHRSKEEILFLISLSGHQEVLAVLRRAAASSSDPTERLRVMMAAFAEFHARTHVHARVINYELAALSPEHLEQVVGLRNQIDAEFTAALRAGMDAGVFHVPDLPMAGRALASLGVDIARWWRPGASWTPEQIAEYYGEVALRIVGAA